MILTSRLLFSLTCAVLMASMVPQAAGASDPDGAETAPPRLHARLDPFSAMSLHAEMRTLVAQHKVPPAMATDFLENAAIAHIGSPARWLAFIPITEGGSGGAFSVLIAGAEHGHLKPLATIQAPQGHARPYVRHDGHFEIVTPVEDSPSPSHVRVRTFAWENGAPRALNETTMNASARPTIMYCAFTQLATNQPPRIAAKSLSGDDDVFSLTPSEPPFVDPLRIVAATYHYDEKLRQTVLDAVDAIVIR